MKRLVILTGASRGMGLAMAEQLLDAGADLLCIARRPNPSLETRGAGRCEQWPHDLARSSSLAAKLGTWLAAKEAGNFDETILINNAGVLPRIAPLGHIRADEIADALRIDLEAPMLLTSAFLGATEHWAGTRKVLNISSGLGRRAMASQAVYCAAKAGMDHFTRCVALEEALRPNGAKVCSLAPGVIDTDMQAHLRSADASEFPDIGNFIELQDKGVLMSPDVAAAKVLAYLARPDFGSNPAGDVRDA
jgi:benzil reductase ((S)-benzoin forming)